MTVRRLVAWVFVWAILLPSQQAVACSPAVTTVTCSADRQFSTTIDGCIDEKREIKLSKSTGSIMFQESSVGSYRGGLVDQAVLAGYEKPGLELVDAVCAIDLSQSPTIDKLYRDWEAGYGSTFEIKSFSTETEAELILTQTNYLSCASAVYVEENGLVAFRDSTKAYCVSSASLLVPCGFGVPIFSPIRFVGYIFTHPDLTTLPYILFSLLVFGLASYGLFVLYRRREIGQFFAPTRTHMWGLILGIPILCIASLGFPTYFSYLIAVYYLFLSFASYRNIKRVKTATS